MKFFASESLSCRCTWAWFKMRYSWLPSCQAMLLLFSRGVVSNSPRPHGLHAARQASLSFTTSQSLLQFTSVELVMPSNHLILCHPLLLFAFNLCQHQGLFQWVSSSHQVPLYPWLYQGHPFFLFSRSITALQC